MALVVAQGPAAPLGAAQGPPLPVSGEHGAAGSALWRLADDLPGSTVGRCAVSFHSPPLTAGRVKRNHSIHPYTWWRKPRAGLRLIGCRWAGSHRGLA